MCIYKPFQICLVTHVTHMHTYVQVIPAIIYDFYNLFCSLFFNQPSPIQLCFYPSTTHFTCPNNRSTGLSLGLINIARMFWTMNTLVLYSPIASMCRVQFLKHDLIQICVMCFIHHVISRMVTHGIATKSLGI